jgi:tetratricopeptide (TPR) repeat protein
VRGGKSKLLMPETPKEILNAADALYAERREPEKVRRSLKLLRESASDYEALWRISRAHFFLGQEAEDKSTARAHHLSGIEAGSLAARASEGSVEGRFWLGVNLALLAQLEKAFKALRLALRARRELKLAVSLNATYHAAGPLRVLARLESKLPRIMGGNRRRAHAYFEEALRLAPANTVTRLYFAEALLECRERERARAELEALLAVPFDPSWAFEIERDKRRARELLSHITE